MFQKYVFLLLSMYLINNSKYWNLSLTLTITLLVFVVFSLIQGLIVFIFFSSSSEGNQIISQDVVYSNLGMISAISSIISSLILFLFIILKGVSIKNYLNLYFPDLKVALNFLLFAGILMFLIEYISNLYPELHTTSHVSL